MSRSIFLKFAIAGFIFFLYPAMTTAQKSDTISITEAWSRSTPPMAKNGAVYFSIVNTGPSDRLIGVSTSIAKRSSLHQTTKDKDIMRMQGVDSIPLPTGIPFKAKPGGHHIMLMGLEKPLKTGKSFDLTFTFEKARQKVVSVTIRK